jgi:ankyrin repeat protein
MNLYDCYGWTVLHRASAFGRPEEVETLIEMGANPTSVALPLKWNAIHHTGFYGNYATFEALLPNFEGAVTELDDKHGWTLLHIAASAGHNLIVRHLLHLGADPNALSQPFTSHMPECLFHRRCTPAEVAEAQSIERKEQSLAVVQGMILSTLSPGQGDPETNELFCDALEAFGDD